MDFEAIIKYPSVFFLALFVTWVLTPVVSRLAVRLGIVDKPGERRIHQGVIPRMGGLAVFLGLQAGLALVYFGPWKPFNGSDDLHGWRTLALGCTAILAVGLWDDWKNIRPAFKFGGQLLVAILTVQQQVQLDDLLHIHLHPALNWGLSVLWILLFINAFNLIDGMDGLATGLALFASLGLAASLFVRQSTAETLVFLSVAGACVGFLRYNFHPASIFLGDCGSMLLGYVLAVGSLSSQSKAPAVVGVGVPLLAMGVPLLDTLLAIWRRSVQPVKAANGKPEPGLLGKLSTADQHHLHHRLLRLGGGQRRAVLLLYGFGAFLSVACLLIEANRSSEQGILLVTMVLLCYMIFRHLAVSELRISGQVILQGLQKPTTRNSAVTIYALSDTLIMALSIPACLWISLNFCPPPGLGMKELVRAITPFLLGVPMLFLLMSGAYSRVWSLARVSEFVFIGFMLLLGILVGHGLLMLFRPDLVQCATLTSLLYIGLVIPVIVFSRALVRVLQDFLALTSRSHHSGARVRRRVLLVGESSAAVMALRHLSASPPPGHAGAEILGIVDDNPVFHRRTVHGVPVLGTLEELGRLVDEHKPNEIMLMSPAGSSTDPRVTAVASAQGLTLVRFEVRLESVPVSAGRGPLAD